MPLDLCPAICPVSESLFGLVVEGALDCLEAIEEFPLHTGRSNDERLNGQKRLKAIAINSPSTTFSSIS